MGDTAKNRIFRETKDRASGSSIAKFYTTSKISENIHETPEGYLVCVGVPIARTGEMVYGEGETPLEVGDDGTVVVSRNADVVFAPETIASFEGKAVTVSHPNDFVSPSNWRELAAGIMQNVRRGTGETENDLLADLLITVGSAIDLVKQGLREVSCGYDAWYVQTGIGRGVQIKIIGNHLALVDEGRAGSGYAINDHKGKGSKMKISDRVKAIFAKAQDEALKVVSEETRDEGVAAATETKSGFVSLDDFKKSMDELGAKIDGYAGKKGKDAAPPDDDKDKPKEKKKEEAKDEEGEPADNPMETRMKALEAAVATILKKIGGDDEEEESTEDGEEDDTTDAEDTADTGDTVDAEDESKTGDAAMTGDTASRVEILAPGMKPGKNAKVLSLKVAYGTKDGKAVIEQFTGGKRPDFKDENLVSTLFVGASELLKVKRNSDFAKTKQTQDFVSHLGVPEGAMTPEKVNEMNAKHYGGSRVN